MPLAKFNKKKANKPAKANRYAAVTPPESRDPILEDGVHKVRVIGTEEFEGEQKGGTYFKATLEIIESSKHEEGEVFCFLQCITKGNAFRIGGPKVQDFVMHAAGFDDFEAFCEAKGGVEEMGVFIDACSGVEEACEEHGENPLEDRTVIVRVQKNGEPKVYEGKDGGEDKVVQYYNYAWEAVVAAKKKKAKAAE